MQIFCRNEYDFNKERTYLRFFLNDDMLRHIDRITSIIKPKKNREDNINRNI